jgi:hypothetical protein
MTPTTSNAGNCTAAALDKGSIERPRFFPRQLITPDDLTLGQDYFRNKLRRLTRYMLGWGVVCGTRVVIPATPQPWKVLVQKGYILGPYGDEIVIDRDLCFDIRTRCMAAASGGDVCSDVAGTADPLCPDQSPDPRKANTPYYIAVRYKEMPSRPVRVQPVGCGCDDTHCEFSRWRDGYEICVLDGCPGSPTSPPDLTQLEHPEGIPDCPACPTDPWVVLTQVTSDDKGNITKIDNCVCRRMAVSLAPFWWRCNEAPWVAATTTAPEMKPVPPAPAPGRGKNPPNQ